MANQLQGELIDANREYEQIIAVWDSYPKQKNLFPYRYLRSLSNFLGSCHMLDRWEQFPVVLDQMALISPSSERLELEIFKSLHYNRLLFWMSKGKWEEARKNVPETARLYAKFEDRLPSSRRLGFCYNLSILFFFLESFNESLAWVNQVINQQKTGQRSDIQLAARVMQMVIHYELGNFDLLPFLGRSLYRLLNQRELKGQFENLVLRFLVDPRAGELFDHPERITPLLTSLEEIKAANPGNIHPGLSELVCWLRSRVKGIPMTVVLENRLAE